jgi:hypothetical protein
MAITVGRILGSTWTLGVAVAFLSWPRHVLTPGADIDGSWQISLQMVASQHIDFGTQYVLNGGPLEFVLHPMVLYSAPAAISAIYLLLTQIALGLTMVWALRRSLPAVVAVPIAYVILMLTFDQFVPAPEPLLALAFIWAMVSIGKEPPAFAPQLVVVGGALISAIALLVQFSDGSQVLFMCAVAVLVMQRDRPRSLPTFAGVFAVTLATLWFATGQGIGNFDDYIRTALEILSQWSIALPFDAPAVSWVRPFALVAITASFGAVFLGTRGLPPLRRAACFLLVAALDFSAWKHGFVINTATYAALFTSLMLLPWIALQWRGPAVGIALAAMAVLVTLFYPVSNHSPSDLTRPLSRAQDAADQLKTLLLPGPRARARSEAREFLRNAYRIDDKTLSLLRGRSVLSYPWDTGLVWAYDLDWYPQPVFPYLAYTPALDRLDARAIEGSPGPDVILRHRPCGATAMPPFVGCEAWVAAGPTFLPHQEPLATIAMLCHFRPVRTTIRFQVLLRVRDRCGRPRRLYSETIANLENAKIPRSVAPNEAVFAQVHGLEPSGLERLRAFLYRAVERVEYFDELYGYRVVPGTMSDGVILRVPTKLNFRPPFPVTPNAKTIGFETKPGFGVSPGSYRIDYFALPVRQSPGHRGRTRQ